MGKRGSGNGGAGNSRAGRKGSGAKGSGMSKDGALTLNSPKTVETTFFEAKGWQGARYSDEVLEATTDGKGNLTFSYARGGTFEKTAKTNRRNNVTYQINAGAVNGSTFNVNWDKVNSIQGQTYNLRKEAKAHGLSWDSANKMWRRK